MPTVDHCAGNNWWAVASFWLGFQSTKTWTLRCHCRGAYSGRLEFVFPGAALSGPALSTVSGLSGSPESLDAGFSQPHPDIPPNPLPCLQSGGDRTWQIGLFQGTHLMPRGTFKPFLIQREINGEFFYECSPGRLSDNCHGKYLTVAFVGFINIFLKIRIL